MFKKNSPELKVLIANIAIVVLITIFSMINYSSAQDLPFMFGIAALGVGLVNLPVGIIVLIAGATDYGKGFLISAGLLLLLSGISCGGGLLLGSY